MPSITHVPGVNDKISRYDISDTQMAAGSTLGSPKATMIIKATGAIEKFYSADIGLEMFGTVLLNHWDDRTGTPLSAMLGTFRIHPEHQEHLFHLSNGVRVHEDLFVLSGKPAGKTVDPPAGYYRIELFNDTQDTVEISTYAFAQLRGNTPRGIASAYSSKHRAIVAWNQENEALARIIGADVEPTSYEVTIGNGSENEPASPGMLSDTTVESNGDPMAVLHFSHRLEPGEFARFHLTLSFSNHGRAGAQRIYAKCPPADAALERTRDYYNEILDRAVVICPDQNVNRGVLWAKANMLRIQSLAPTGWCFVNDPTRSNNSVARDTAWFAFGADYITPDFCRESLLWYAEHLEKSGMVVEYYDIRTGKTADYKLNINDNTPLLILAMWHHYNVCGDIDVLEAGLSTSGQGGSLYPLTAQRTRAGVVHGQGYIRLGNRRLAQRHRELPSIGRDDRGQLRVLRSACKPFRTWRGCSRSTTDAIACSKKPPKRCGTAINEHLLDPVTKLYYLNIDLDGSKRSDCTADMVFPVMFGVADDEIAARIIARLSNEEFLDDGRDSHGAADGRELRADPWLRIARRRMGRGELLVRGCGSSIQPCAHGAFARCKLSTLLERSAPQQHGAGSVLGMASWRNAGEPRDDALALVSSALPMGRDRRRGRVRHFDRNADRQSAPRARMAMDGRLEPALSRKKSHLVRRPASRTTNVWEFSVRSLDHEHRI